MKGEFGRGKGEGGRRKAEGGKERRWEGEKVRRSEDRKWYELEEGREKVEVGPVVVR